MKKYLFISGIMGIFLTLNAADGLIKNPEFKAAEGNWTLSTMAEEVFELKYYDDYVEIASTGPDYSGYLVQKVQVKPNTKYRLSIDLRQLNGRGLIWIVGYDKAQQPLLYDQRKYLISAVGNPLVPNFVDKKLLQGSSNDQWRRETLEFDTGKLQEKNKELHYIRISVGVYFSTAKLHFRHIDLVEVKP